MNIYPYFGHIHSKQKLPQVIDSQEFFVTAHKKKTLPFGDVFFRGCPDGLEPKAILNFIYHNR